MSKVLFNKTLWFSEPRGFACNLVTRSELFVHEKSSETPPNQPEASCFASLWLNRNRRYLSLAYPGKTVVIWDNEIKKIYDGRVDRSVIKRFVDENCPHNDWAYKFVTPRGLHIL